MPLTAYQFIDAVVGIGIPGWRSTVPHVEDATDTVAVAFNFMEPRFGLQRCVFVTATKDELVKNDMEKVKALANAKIKAAVATVSNREKMDDIEGIPHDIRGDWSENALRWPAKRFVEWSNEMTERMKDAEFADLYRRANGAHNRKSFAEAA